MYNNIGVTTARGTGTNGYVQRSAAALPKNRQPMSWEASLEYEEKVKQRKPVQMVADKEILDHERKKKIEIALLEWAEATGLLDSGKPQEEIDQAMNEKRVQIAAQHERFGAPKKAQENVPRSSHQERYEKEQHQARLASALGIREDYQEGQAFDKEYQMKEREARAQQREKMELLKREEARIMRQLEETRREKERREPKRSEEPDYGRRRGREIDSPPRRSSRDDRSDRRDRDDDSPPRGERRSRRSPTPSPPRGGRRGERSPSPGRRSPTYSPPRSRRIDITPPDSPTYAPPTHTEDKHESRSSSQMDVDVAEKKGPIQAVAEASSAAPASVPTANETAMPISKEKVAEHLNNKPTEEEEKPSETSKMAVDPVEAAAPESHEASPTKSPRAKKAKAAGKKAAAASADAEGEDEKPTPKKAGRGRPKKAAVAAAEEDEAKESETATKEAVEETEHAAEEAEKPTPKKAGRGRPKKDAAAPAEETADTEEAKDEAEAEPEPEAPKRAKRGRAKKAAAESDDEAEEAPKPKRAKRAGK